MKPTLSDYLIGLMSCNCGTATSEMVEPYVAEIKDLFKNKIPDVLNYDFDTHFELIAQKMIDDYKKEIDLI